MKQEQNIILFDGVCNLCNSSVDFILKKAQTDDHFKMIPLQADEGQKIIKQFELPMEPDSVLFIQNEQLFSESDALLEICKHLRAPWRWLTILRILPKKFRDALYRLVAKKRYKWFGKRNACRMI